MIRLHNQNRTHTFIDVESGPFISLPKDETDKPPVNADVNGLMIYGKTIQDGEPTPDNPVDPVSIPSEFNLTVCGKNILPDKEENWEQGTLNSSTGENVSASNRIRLKSEYMIKVSPNTLITGSFISGYVLLAVHEYNINKEWIGRQAEMSTVTVSENTHFVRLVVARADSGDLVPSDIEIINAQLELGNMSTPYQPYLGSTYPYRIEDLDGNLHELCSLPDGTRDEYDRDSGILIKRVKRLTVTSGTTSEPINLQARYYTASADRTDFTIYWNDTTNRWSSISVSYNLRCNILMPGGGEFKCSLHLRTNDTTLQMRYPKDLLISRGYTLDDDGVRRYINDIINANGKPIVFYYPYSEPQIIPIKQYGKVYDGQVWDKNEKPKSIQYHTNIFTDVGAEMQCEVRKLGNRAMGTFNWITENGDKIITEDEDYIMFEY